MAPLVGKAPPNIEIWAVTGQAPTFVREQGPIYPDGPVMTIQLVSPTWPDSAKFRQLDRLSAPRDPLNLRFARRSRGLSKFSEIISDTMSIGLGLRRHWSEALNAYNP